MAQSLQKVEASYRGIVEDLSDLICRYRPDGRLTFVNTAYARFFGKGRNELAGQIFPPHAAGLLPRAKDGAVLAVAAFEQEMVNAQGGRLWIAWTNRAIADVDGESSNIRRSATISRRAGRPRTPSAGRRRRRKPPIAPRANFWPSSATRSRRPSTA